MCRIANTSFAVSVMSSVLLGLPQASAQTAGTPPAAAESKLCNDGKFREFDFWVGEWTVENAAGKLAGRNSITSEEKGCVVIERWRAANGGTGQSLNYYDPVSKLWKQRWVGLGLILEMQGGMKDGAMVLEGPLHYVQPNRTTILRGIWSTLPGGRVRQQFVESADNGKTWAPWFDGYYTRTKSAPKD